MRTKRMTSYIKRNPGLLILLILLLFLNFAMIKPQFYLIGWDNFSSYFNLKTNLFRTLFSAWREYRGLGVPSDSEVVDLFRQLFFLLFSPFVRENLLDQIYFIFCLDLGVLAVYFFTKNLFHRAFTEDKFKYLDAAAFIAAFFYLFNLNTLVTFYFPMAMYINRFAAAPLLFFIFFKLSQEKRISLKTWCLAVLATFFTATSYLTATIFITVLLFVFVFSLFLANRRRQVSICLLFVCLNLFWLLPFANYAFKKANIVELAPSFIEANESQLNKPASFYSADRLLSLYPNFLDTKITDIAEDSSHYLYPQTNLFRSVVGRVVLFIFPFFYLGGVALILARYRRRILLWIPTTIFLSLFLVGKEFTPLGFFYRLIEGIVPYFDVLFRFADTKFNIFIAFGGSVGAALFFGFLFNFFRDGKRIYRGVVALVLLVLIPYLFLFSSFGRNFIAPLMYNKIPPAYFEITEIINEDKDDFRVLHLPLNRSGYWKFYTWGAAGSAFLNFMLDKPLIDRTFEPASMENAFLHQAIFRKTDNAQGINNQEELNKRSKEFYNLLSNLGVKYIIWDETVSDVVYSRGVKFWGEFDSYDVKKILENLEDLELLKTETEAQINIFDYLDLYPQRFLLDQKAADYLAEKPFSSLKLLKIKDFKPKFYFAQEAILADSDLDNFLATDLVFRNQNYIQGEKQTADIFFPFQRENASLVKNENGMSLSFRNVLSGTQDYVISSTGGTEETSRLIEVYAHGDDRDLVISFYHLPLPVIQGQKKKEPLGQLKVPLALVEGSLKVGSSLDNYFSDWRILPFKNTSDLRLNINGYILPLPSGLTSGEELVATVVVSGDKANVELLAKEESINVDLGEFQTTGDPNCFGDKIEDYRFELKRLEEKLVLSSRNGSTCLIKPIQTDLSREAAHLEVKLDLESKAEDLDRQYSQGLERSAKPFLKNFILNQPKPNLFRICIRGQHTEACFNKHQVLNLQDKQTMTIPLERPVKSLYEPLILMATNNLTYQEQTVTLNTVVFDQFKTIKKTELPIKSLIEPQMVSFNDKQEINLEVPQALSQQSFYFDKEKDGFYLSNQPCREEPSSYRTFRLIKGNWVSFFENCSNLLSVKNDFNSDHFYLWKIGYHLFSGKYPKYLLETSPLLYKDGYLSLNQGYPRITSFKDLQKPEGLIARLTRPAYQKELEKKFSETTFKTTYTYIYPQLGLDDKEEKDYTLQQNSENEGIFSLSSFDILELPNSWENLTISRANGSKQYALTQKIESEQVLPSFWRVHLQPSKEGKPLLLVFNEAYDRQWQIHESLLSLLLGRQSEKTVHLKFNGYANAWEINNPEEKVFYLFYAPERLSWLGWGLTLATIVISFISLRFWTLRKSRKTNQLN